MTDERGLREGLGDGAQSCIIRQAEEIAALNEQVAALREALNPFRGFWSDGELRGLPDCHLFEMVWSRDDVDRINEDTGKHYPAITAGQLRRAHAALAAAEPKGDAE